VRAREDRRGEDAHRANGRDDIYASLYRMQFKEENSIGDADVD